VILAADVNPVHLDDPIALAQSGHGRRRPVVDVSDELADLVLLGAQVEPVPGEVGRLDEVAESRARRVFHRRVQRGF
jgi:hypothetical protein